MKVQLIDFFHIRDDAIFFLIYAKKNNNTKKETKKEFSINRNLVLISFHSKRNKAKQVGRPTSGKQRTNLRFK